MKRKKNFSKALFLSFLILLLASLAYLYNSKIFEQKAPIIDLKKNIYWNFKKPISVKITDDSGIKFIRVTLSDTKSSIVLTKKVFSTPKQKYILNIKFPRTGFVINKRKFKLIVESVDSSKWNFFSGNKRVQTSIIHVDTKRPELFIINNSYKITKGGAAAVIFKVKDKNLKELYIRTNFNKIFKPIPFYKKNYYISLLAWPANQKSFKATIIAKDFAGNIAKSRVRLYLKKKRYRVSKLALKDRFIEGKITDLIEDENVNPKEMNEIDKFKYVNEKMRKDNEDKIAAITSIVEKKMIGSFNIKPFYPLKNSAAVASFGDYRQYKYRANLISESYHLGLDLASISGANVVTSNSGEVVFAKYNGIYGKNIIISHGLGLYSLYAHNSVFLVDNDERVEAGDVIAKTGMSGLALGDHLHFGILVQGVEVRPEEWMDKKWIKDNVTDIIKSAKKIIDQK